MGVVIGVDPGLSGAFAAISGSTVLHVDDMPTRQGSANGKAKRVLNREGLQLVARALVGTYRPGLVVIEDVHAMPRQGVVSSFTFGNVFGSLVQAFVAEGANLLLVPPALWKRRLGITADKASSKALADQLFPASKAYWAKRSQDGRAEAALIGYYGILDSPAAAAVPAEVPYWLCCGSTKYPHGAEVCHEAAMGDPRLVRFGTLSEHRYWMWKTYRERYSR